jgi:hypothetical protein
MVEKSLTNKTLFKLFIALLLISGLFTSCAPTVGNNPQVWIDVPHAGSVIQAGQAVEVQAHAYAPDGVAEVLFSVDGTPYRREPPQEPASEFTPIVQQWQSDEPGDHYLQLEVFDSQGKGSLPVGVWVKVLPAEAEADISALPTLTLTPSLVETRTLLPPTDTPMSTQTTTWTMVPPTITSTPLPSATSKPLPPPDSTPPTIGSITESADPVYKPFCDPNTLTISAQVSDSGGVSKVKLVYRVVEGTRKGQWHTVTMNSTGGNTYRATLDWNDFEASLDPPVVSGATIEYYIQAKDSNNNQSQSGTQTTSLKDCLV